MLCYRCNKTKSSAEFTKAKACDECHDKDKAYREANKERYQANRRAKAAVKNEEKRKQREALKQLQQLEKARIQEQEQLQKQSTKECPYEQLKKQGIFMKTCGTCHKEKTLDEFRLIKKLGNEQLAPNCTNCFDRARAYYEKNKGKMLAKSKEYKEKNAETIREQRRQYLKETHEYVRQREKAYWERNREHLNAKIAEYQRTNKHVRMKARISGRIRENIKKLKSTKDYIGCGGDMEVLLRWLEHQFDENMNWDNYGKYWQIDHVLPVKKFNLDNEEEVHVCFSWMNVQPLERLANTSKHNKILSDMVDAYIEKLKLYGDTAHCKEEVCTYLIKYIPLYNKFKAL